MTRMKTKRIPALRERAMERRGYAPGRERRVRKCLQPKKLHRFSGRPRRCFFVRSFGNPYVPGCGDPVPVHAASNGFLFPWARRRCLLRDPAARLAPRPCRAQTGCARNVVRREKARSLSGLEPPSTTRTTRFPLSPSGMLLSFHSREESLRWPLVPAAQLIA